MDRWDSDFEYFITDDIKTAGDWLGQTKIEEFQLDNGGYDFTILLDGNDYNQLYYESDNYDIFVGVCNQIEIISQTVLDSWVDKQNAEKLQKEAKQKAAAEQAKIDRDYKEFLRLKEQFEAK